MGLFNWIFGKHAKRPPDPNRTASAALLPRWQAELVIDELHAAGVSAVLSDEHTAYLTTATSEAQANVFVAETDVAAARTIIAEVVEQAAPDHVLRPTSVADGPLLRSMLHAAIFVPEGSGPPPASVVDEPPLRRYVEDFGERAGDVGWVAESLDGDEIGAVWLRRFPADGPGFGFIDAGTPELSIAVLEPHRDRGIGSALLVAVLDGVERVSLSVDARSPAVALYERFGFEVINSTGTSLVMLRVADRVDVDGTIGLD